MAGGGIIISGLSSTSSSSTYARLGAAAQNSSTTINASSWAAITFDVEIEDTGNNFDMTTFTVPTGQGGMYSISACIVFASVTDGNRYIVGVYKNSSLAYILGRGTAGATQLQGVGGNVKTELAEGDTINIRAYSDNATNCYPTSGYNSMSIYKMP